MTSIFSDRDAEDFPGDELLLAVYDVERRPFTYLSQDISHLPQEMQAFLVGAGLVGAEAGVAGFQSMSGNWVTEGIDNAHVLSDHLLAIQKAEFARLERNTWGVHRMIVTLMLQLSTDEDITDKDAFLKRVLIPEWRKHLDDFVDRKNALIWFEKYTRQGTLFKKEHKDYMEERKRAIFEMIRFILQRLQNIKEELLTLHGLSLHSGRVDSAGSQLELEEILGQWEDAEAESDEELFSASSGRCHEDCQWDCASSDDSPSGSIFSGSYDDCDHTSARSYSPSESIMSSTSTRATYPPCNHIGASVEDLEGSILLNNHGPSFIFPRL